MSILDMLAYSFCLNIKYLILVSKWICHYVSINVLIFSPLIKIHDNDYEIIRHTIQEEIKV